MEPAFSETINEDQRIRDLESYRELDTREEEEFEILARLAIQFCGTQMSQINFVYREHIWCNVSIPESARELPRGESFCSATILQDDWLIVEDAIKDGRFNHLKIVREEPYIRFYAGINLKSDKGHNIGTICVLDTQPKRLEDWQLESLKSLARETQLRLELRKKEHLLEQRKEELEEQAIFLNNSTDLIFTINPHDQTILDINRDVIDVLEYRADDLLGCNIGDLTEENDLFEQLSDWKKNPEGIFIGEFRFVSKSKKNIWLRIHLTENKDKWYVTARDITQRKLQEAEIEQSLREKEVLLAEIHHRVKNNLAVISGLLQLEAFQTKDELTHDILQNSQMRIKSMSVIHEIIYQEGDFSNVSLEPFAANLIENIKQAYKLDQRNIQVYSDVSEIKLNVNQAIPAALIINELVANACKYAFENRDSGRIDLTIRNEGDLIELQVSDNGIGLPPEYNLESENSIGFTLVNILVKQLQAESAIHRNSGTSFLIRFNAEENKKGSAARYLMNN